MNLKESIGTEEVWVVEWSESQQCFHVDLLDKSLETNTRNYLEGRKTDFVPIGVFATAEEATSYTETMKSQRF